MNIVKWLQHIVLATFVPLLLCSFNIPGRTNRNRTAELAEQMFRIHNSDTLESPFADSLALPVERFPGDSLHNALKDSALLQVKSDTAARGMSPDDSLALLGKSSLERPAFSTAKDSIIEDFSNGKQLLILTEKNIVDGADKLSVTFANDIVVDAVAVKYDSNTGIAIVSVDKSLIDESTMAAVSIAKIGNSNIMSRGALVIALETNYSIMSGCIFTIQIVRRYIRINKSTGCIFEFFAI